MLSTPGAPPVGDTCRSPRPRPPPAPVAAAAPAVDEERIVQLEEDVALLRRQVAELRAELGLEG